MYTKEEDGEKLKSKSVIEETWRQKEITIARSELKISTVSLKTDWYVLLLFGLTLNEYFFFFFPFFNFKLIRTRVLSFPLAF